MPPSYIKYNRNYILAQMRTVAGREDRDLKLYQYLIDQSMAVPMAQQQRIFTNTSVLRTNRDVTRRNLELTKDKLNKFISTGTFQFSDPNSQGTKKVNIYKDSSDDN